MLHLNIAINPVQGFVAQSRRTRDLWGSSYLVSFLAGHAMYGAVKAGGRIVWPNVANNKMYRRIENGGSDEVPQIGMLPSHFEIKTEEDPSVVAEAAEASFQFAWSCVCEAVWNKFVNFAAECGNGTQVIWERQTKAGAYWDFTWVAGKSSDQGQLHERRQHWQRNYRPAEPGDKCTVMHDYQELSGYIRSRGNRDRQDRFWNVIRNCLDLMPLDLRDNERLCAIALVKRLFPLVADKALGWKLDVLHWPSTVYIGAVPWIKTVVKNTPEKAQEYAEAVKANTNEGVLADRHRAFRDLNLFSENDFIRIDGNYFHQSFIGNGQFCPLGKVASDKIYDVQNELTERLISIYEEHASLGRPIGEPSAYFSLLYADGDRLGNMGGEFGGSLLGEALDNFTRQAPTIIEENCGVPVYAGGDDVLAMLPVTHALSCAKALSECFKTSFHGKRRATLSAAIVFAHVRLPLNATLGEARRLLDDVAKEENGRDSLAVAVLKRGGLHCQWVTSWNRSGLGMEKGSAVEQVGDLAKKLYMRDNELGLSSSLIFRVVELLSGLFGWQLWKPGAWGSRSGDIDDFRVLLRAEIRHSLEVRIGDEAEGSVEELINLVWCVLGRSRSTVDRTGVESTEFGVDALLLARFLSEHLGENS